MSECEAVEHRRNRGRGCLLTERHLATLTTLRADGSPHVVPVGVTYDPATRTARVITSGTSAKARHVRAGRSRVAVCQVSGGAHGAPGSTRRLNQTMSIAGRR